MMNPGDSREIDSAGIDSLRDQVDTAQEQTSSQNLELADNDALTEKAKVYKELGDAELAKEEFQNALSFYTQGIDVKCKDDQLNVELYRSRWLSNCHLGNVHEAFEDLNRIQEITEPVDTAQEQTSSQNMDLTANDALTGNVHEAFEDLNRIQEITEPVDTAQEQTSSQSMDLTDNDALTGNVHEAFEDLNRIQEITEPVDTAQEQTSSENMDLTDNNALTGNVHEAFEDLNRIQEITEPVDTAQEQSSSQNVNLADNDALTGNVPEAFGDLNRIQEIKGTVETTHNQATLIPEMEFDDDTLREPVDTAQEQTSSQNMDLTDNDALMGNVYEAFEDLNRIQEITEPVDTAQEQTSSENMDLLDNNALTEPVDTAQERPSSQNMNLTDNDALTGNVHEAFEDLNRIQEITEPVDTAQEQTSSENIDLTDNNALTGNVHEGIEDLNRIQEITEPVDTAQEQSSPQNMDLTDNDALTGNVPEAFEDLKRIQEITGPVETTHNQATLIPEMEFDDDTLREPVDTSQEQSSSQNVDLADNDALTGNVHEAFEDLNRIQEITEPVDTAQEQSSSQNMDLADNDALTEPVDTKQEQSSSQNMDLADDDALIETVKIYKELGDTELAKEEFQNAISFYTQGIDVNCKDDQLNVKIYLARSRSQGHLKNLQEALEDLHRVEEITEMNPSALHGTDLDHASLRARVKYLKGELEHDKKDCREALRYYTEGIELKCKDDKINAKLYSRRSHSHNHLGNLQEQLEDLQHLEEISEMNPSALHGTGLDRASLRANTRLIKGAIEMKNDLRIALSCLTEGIEVNCKDDRLNAMLYFCRSIIHHNLGNLQEELEDLQHLEEISEMNPSALHGTGRDHDSLRAKVKYLKGELEHDRKDYRKALSYYTEGIELKCKDDKLNAKLYFRRSHSHNHLGNFQEELKDLHRVEEITEMNPSVLHGTGLDHDSLRAKVKYLKGRLPVDRKDHRKALSYYTEAIELKCKDDELNARLYLERLISHAHLENFQEALKDLHRVEEITEMNPSALHGIGLDHDSLRARKHWIQGMLEDKKNNLRNAASCYTEGIALKCKNDNLNGFLCFLRANIHQRLGNFQDALDDLKKALDQEISQEAGFSDTYHFLRELEEKFKTGAEFKQNDFRNALSCYIKGIDMNCKDHGLNLNLYSKRAVLHLSPGNSREGHIGKNRAEEFRQEFFIEPFDQNEQQLTLAMNVSASRQLDFDDDTLREAAQKNEEKGDAKYKANEFSNAAVFYTEGIEVSCKDVALNAVLYKKRATCHFFLGNAPETRSDLNIATEILLANLTATEKDDAECKEIESGNLLSFFTEGADVTCQDDELNAIFYTRRAASHFSIGNFHNAVMDAKRARAFHYCYRGVRTFQKSPLQAIVTGAKACMELQLYEETIKWCCDGLTIDQENKTLQEVKRVSIENEAKTTDVQKLNAVKEVNDGKGSFSSKIIGECTGLSYGARNEFDRARGYLTSFGVRKKDRGMGSNVKEYSRSGFDLLASGKKKEAIPLFNQSLAVYRKSGDREGEESVGVILAVIYQSLSWECHLAQDYRNAEEYFKRRVEIMKETGLAAAQQERIGEPHFNLYQVCRNFKKAEEYYSEELAVCKKMGDRSGEAQANRNLGDTCYLTGLDEVRSSNYMRDAMSYYQDYLHISVELGDKGKEGDAYFSIGRIHQYLRDQEKTKHDYSKCLTICEEIGDREGEKHALRKLRSTIFIRGDLKQVMQLNNKLHFISKKSHDHFHEAEALIYQGHCLVECRFFSDAVLSYQSAVEKANFIRDWNILEDWMKISLRQFFRIAYAALSATLLRLDKTDEALLAAEKGRAQALADLLETQYGFEARHHGKESAGSLQQETTSELFTRTPANTIFLAVFQDVMSVWLLQDGKQVHFSQSNLAEHHSEDQSSFLEETYKEVGVKPRVRCEDRSLDALRYKGGLTVQRPTDLSLLSFDQIPRNGDENASGTSAPVHRKRLPVLYDVIVAPVIPHLRGNEVVIVPDGEFFLVPFGALQDTESRYLCESFSIRVIPSLTCLKMITDAPTDHHCKRGALVVGDPWVQEVQHYDGRKPCQLPGARKEAEMIAAIAKTSPLIGSDATKEAVLSRLNNVALIHLAAHGDSKTGEILLAPNLSRESKIPSRKDYLLTMPDVLSVGLRARLVVLSCCHSGQGEVCDEGVVGIARAFLGAGARSVLVALWAIDDDATLEFMRVFYKHLTRGKKASQALSGAANYMRESSHMRKPTDFGATHLWAPFVLIGDDVALDCFEED